MVKESTMHPLTRPRPGVPVVLRGAALLGLAALASCGPKEARREAPKFVIPGGPTASAPPAPPKPTGDQPGLPVVRILSDQLVTAGTSGHKASVSGDSGLQYEWFIEGGSFDGDIHGDSVRWTAGVPGEVRLFCQGTNAAGKKSVALARVEAEAAPTIDGFLARPAVISLGRSTKLSWNAKETKTLILDPGDQDVAKVTGPGFEVKPQETTQYTLTATTAAGASVSKTVGGKVVPPPAISLFRAEGAISFGQALSLVGGFSGGKAEISRGGTVLASGETSPLQVRVDVLKEGDSFSFTVTNEAGDRVARSLTFNAPARGAYPKQ